MKKSYSKNTTAIIISLIIILSACKKNTTDNNTPSPVITFQKIYDIPINRESMYYAQFSQTSDNGFFVAGALSTDIYVDKSISFLIKTDGATNVIWAKTYSINGGINCRAATQTSDGGYMLVGNSTVPGSSAMIFLIKTNANGDIVWTKIIHLERDAVFHYPAYCTDVKQTNDSGFIVKGSYSDIINDDNPFLLKTDAAGNIQWMKSYRISIGNNYSEKRIIVSRDNGCVFVTYASGPILVKIKSNGDIDWNKPFNADNYNYEVGPGIQTNDGGYAFTGYSIRDVNEARAEVALIKADANGSIMWGKKYGGDSSDEVGNSIIQASDGGYVIGGTTAGFSSQSNGGVYIVKTNEQGDTTWTRMYDGANPSGYSGVSFGGNPTLQLSQDMGYILAAGARVLDLGAQTGERIYLAKTDNNGHIGCNEKSLITTVTNMSFNNSPPVNFSIVDLNPQIFDASITTSAVLTNTTTICPP
jgi:hypothetical protein